MTGRHPADIKRRMAEAIDYAEALLTEFEGVEEPASVDAHLASLEDEYRRAKRERRGMDPDLVKIAIQGIFDRATFAPSDRPEPADPDDPSTWHADGPAGDGLPLRPVFRIRPVRPGPKEKADGWVIAYVAGAVGGRFRLTPYRNADPSEGAPLDGETSALDAVAEAMFRLGRKPETYSAIKDALSCLPDAKAAFSEGRLRGLAERDQVAGN